MWTELSVRVVRLARLFQILLRIVEERLRIVRFRHRLRARTGPQRLTGRPHVGLDFSPVVWIGVGDRAARHVAQTGETGIMRRAALGGWRVALRAGAAGRAENKDRCDKNCAHLQLSPGTIPALQTSYTSARLCATTRSDITIPP